MPEKLYSELGSLRTCPFSNDLSIITVPNNGEDVAEDRSQCPHASECSVDACPLANNLKRY